jgi:hypothetical protein
VPNSGLVTGHAIFSGRRRSAAIALILLPFLAGCPSPPSTSRVTTRAEQEDALGNIRDTLRKDRKLDGFKTAVAQLDVYLARPNESKPNPVSESELQIARHLQLSEDEIKEVTRPDFSPLDVYYFDECFLFHDAVRALKLDWSQSSDESQLQRAQLGFAWAMRQVWLQDKPGPRPLPPSFTLRIGSGSLAERTGVALAVFRTLGLDAGLVGPGKVPAAFRQWAIGVRIGNEVYLFDPHAGEAVPGANRRGIATLRQARATPELVKTQIAAALGNTDLRKAAGESRVWLSPALSSLTPRMRWLQSEIVLAPPLVLGVDLAAQSERFAKAGETVDWWNPRDDHNTPTRTLAHFLPTSEGGFDQAPAGQRYFDTYPRPLIPMNQLPELLRSGVVTGFPAIRLNERFASRFITIQTQPGEPHDLILRGQFDDANTALIEQLGRYATLQKRIATEPNLDADARKWAEEIVSALARHLRLQRDRAPEAEVQAALERVKALDKDNEKISLVIERSAIEPHGAVLTFLLAQSKHEQAERLSRSGRDDPQQLRDAWQTAAGWWRNFISRAASNSWIQPAQVDHARKMLADVQSEIAKTAAPK